MADTGRRQQPGFACEECRRRKARCDRVRPKCGHCMETDMTCVILAKKSQRGPKKGQLAALRSQIGLYPSLSLFYPISGSLDAHVSEA